MSDPGPDAATAELQSLKPIEGADRPLRHRLGVRGELILAALPTGIILAVLFFLEVLSSQRVLFASLASSATRSASR